VSSQGEGFAVEAARAMCEWLAGHDVKVITSHIDPRRRVDLGHCERASV